MPFIPGSDALAHSIYSSGSHTGKSYQSGPQSQCLSFSRLGWSLRLCFSSKFPGAADAAGPGRVPHLPQSGSKALSKDVRVLG